MTNDFQILIEMLKDELVEFVDQSDYLNEKLTQNQRIELMEVIDELTDKEVVEIFLGEQDAEKIRDFQSKFSKFLRYSLAVIASGALVGAPLLGPLIYFLYRKAMDPCKKTCYTKYEQRLEKQKCKYQCQMRVTLEMLRKLKGDLSDCARQKKRKKCENRMKKAITKWTKKYNEAKERYKKADEKMRLKMRKKFGYTESVSLKKLNEQEDAKDGEALIKPSQPNPRINRIVRTAQTQGLHSVPVPLISVALNEIVKRTEYSCMRRCFVNPSSNKRFCYEKCRFYGREIGVGLLKKGLAQCGKSAQPDKCKRKMAVLLKEWQKRLVQTRNTYQKGLKKKRAKLTAD